jgi:dUTP pyrophosphatase
MIKNMSDTNLFLTSSSETEKQKLSYELGFNYDNNTNIEETVLCIKSFLRGVFEKRSSVPRRSVLTKEYLSLEINVDKFITDLINNLDISFVLNQQNNIFYIELTDYNAFDFLTKIYDNSDARYRNTHYYNNYIEWATFGLHNTLPNCKFYKAEECAIIPKKERSSDVGYDLTIIKKVKNIGSKTSLYDTGIIVAPDFGYYTKIVPRSSIIKSGYMLTNSMGIIDGTYRGRLMICLTKIDDSMPDLELPFRCCQLILDRFLHYTLEEVDSEENLGNTNRGTGGFGSTGV